MAIDSALDDYYASQLREEKNSAKQERAEKPKAPTGSLRQIIAQEKRQKANARIERMKAKANVGDGAGTTVFNPAKKGTGTLLKVAWNALIPSFGLSLIYIDLHVFLRWVIGDKLFCKLGEEWLPKSAGELGGAKGMAGIVETMILILVNVIYLGIIGMIAVFIIYIVQKIYGSVVFSTAAWIWNWSSALGAWVSGN